MDGLSSGFWILSPPSFVIRQSATTSPSRAPRISEERFVVWGSKEEDSVPHDRPRTGVRSVARSFWEMAERKGWLTRKGILNCLPLAEVEQALRAKREKMA
jgi:hypothetical protein